MHTYTITIETGNKAFADGREVEAARILTELAEELKTTSMTDGDSLILHDGDGNRCGVFSVNDGSSRELGDAQHPGPRAPYRRSGHRLP